MEALVRRMPQQLYCRRWAWLASHLASCPRSQQPSPGTDLSHGTPPWCTSLVHLRGMSSAQSGLTCQRLDQRTLLRAAGPDASSFLQGLVTNDMGCLRPEKVSCGSTLYAFMLNVQGRVLYDLIIYAVGRKHGNNDEFYIESNRDVSQDLLALVKRYKIRTKVDLSHIGDKFAVWAVLPSSGTTHTSDPPVVSVLDESKVVMVEPDPRLKAFGYRAVLPSGVDASTVLADTVNTDDPLFYMKRRFQEGLAEGSTELPPGNCFPLESNAVFLNGVNFSKGCYLGQELTARTHHTGVTRKRIMPITLDRELTCDGETTLENNKGKNSGKLRAVVERHGLALLRVSDVIGKGPLSVKDSEGGTLGSGTAHIPDWWPVDTDEIVKQAVAKSKTVES